MEVTSARNWMLHPPRYIFDGLNVWEHRVFNYHKTPGYVKLDRMKSGKFRVNRSQSLIYTATAYLYVNMGKFQVLKDPNNEYELSGPLYELTSLDN